MNITNSLNKQDTFNAIVDGLGDQGWKQSTNGDGDCKYRGEKGLKCSIGLVIGDDLYDLKLEDADAIGLSRLSIFRDTHIEKYWPMLQDMQTFHDLALLTALNYSELREELERLAKKHAVMLDDDILLLEIQQEKRDAL